MLLVEVVFLIQYSNKNMNFSKISQLAPKTENGFLELLIKSSYKTF